MRERFVVINGALMPWEPVARIRRVQASIKRSDLAAPIVIRDALDGVVNPCDGKPYDSKQAYYRTVKDHGCVIVGDEAEKMAENPPDPQSNVTGEEVYEAMQKVEAGYRPQPLEFDETA